MRSELVESEEIREYPYLGKHGMLVVLFSRPETGMVLYTNGDTRWDIGYYAIDWQESDFKLMANKLELSN